MRNSVSKVKFDDTTMWCRAIMAIMAIVGALVLASGCMGEADPASADAPGRDDGAGGADRPVYKSGYSRPGIVSIYIDGVDPWGVPDVEKTSLQDAFVYVMQSSVRTHPVYMFIGAGTYRHDESTLTVPEKDWRNNCASKSATTAFLLANRQAITEIYGDTGNPADVIIWSKVPNHIVSNPGSGSSKKVFHGLSLYNNSAPVTIGHVSLVSDGGYTENGAGDASLDVVQTSGMLFHSIVLANKTSSNCLWSKPERDQEGVLLSGVSTNFTIQDSAVGGNLHTGVMLLDGARATVYRSLVRGNGWGVPDIQNNHKGHGITEFHGAGATCYNGNTELDVIDSVVRSNSGNGVYMRGDYTGSTQSLDDNTISYNAVNGVRVDGGGEITSFVNAGLAVTTNRMEQNSSGNIAIDYNTISCNGVIPGNGCIYTASNGTNQTGGSEPAGLWNSLLAANSYMGTIPVTCP